MGASRITLTPDDYYSELCLATGHLFLLFGALETQLTGTLKLHMAKNLSDDDTKSEPLFFASAVYGSMRFNNSRDVIKRICVAENAEDKKLEFLSNIFAQVGTVQDLRDKLAHQSIPIK